MSQANTSLAAATAAKFTCPQFKELISIWAYQLSNGENSKDSLALATAAGFICLSQFELWTVIAYFLSATAGGINPVLDASVPTAMVTTYAGSPPDHWILQASLNGTSGWTTANTNSNTPATWIAETFDLFYRCVGQNVSNVNITTFSNVVSI